MSSEKREGTLGLLFLTNLNGLEIMAGKLCSNALAAAYGLCAVFPLLALQMLMGGVTMGDFWRTVLALGNTIFFSIASGFLVSSICARQFIAVAAASALALFASVGIYGFTVIARVFPKTKAWADVLANFSPLYTLASARVGAGAGRGLTAHYWWSMSAVSGVSCLFLAVATWRVTRAWRDRAAAPRNWFWFRAMESWRVRGKASRLALRRRLLPINPIFWLGGRQVISAPVLMLLTVALVFIVSGVLAPTFARVIPAGPVSPMVGHLLAWFFAGLTFQALVMYYAAMTASRTLAEDKQTGALELVLSTPTSERLIFRGLWMAYGRKMFFPAVVIILVHFFFVWVAASMCVLDSSSLELPRGITPGQLIWHVLTGDAVIGRRISWGLSLGMRMVLLSLVMSFCSWLTFGWLGRWLGLSMKRPGFAPMISVALLCVPSILLFTLACYCSEKVHLTRIPERILIPIMVWVAFGIWSILCLLLSVWAAGCLRANFRTVVTSRFQPRHARRWWRPGRRGLVRIGIAAVSATAAVVLLILFSYGYQNWQSRRGWIAFQKELKQRRESLDVAPLLPLPVPQNENFAFSAPFLSWASSSRSNTVTKMLLKDLARFDDFTGTASPTGVEWTTQSSAPLDLYGRWIAPQAGLSESSSSEESANAILQGLKPYAETLHQLAAAARLPYFQTGTNRNALAVLNSAREPNAALVRLHMLFQIRACAFLAVNRNDEAAEDLMTGLRLAGLARQIPDIASVMRTQNMLARSMQPLWEGLTAQHWNQSQILGFQRELGNFNLLSDYTNAVRRVVLAYNQTWQDFSTNKSLATPVGSYDGPFLQIQPRAWWLDNCVQLYEAGQQAINSVDVANSRAVMQPTWVDLNGLPLDAQANQLLQHFYWIGPNPSLLPFAQNAVNQAMIACALERFRLEQGHYPETLSPLLTNYLAEIPKDVARGLPMLYENEAGRFTLRSVGPNQTIDRNKPVSDDWLWSFPTNSPPIGVR